MKTKGNTKVQQVVVGPTFLVHKLIDKSIVTPTNIKQQLI